jgi:hypothetical protein
MRGRGHAHDCILQMLARFVLAEDPPYVTFGGGSY